MSCGEGGPLGRPAFCPASGFDTGSRRPVAWHMSGKGSWSAAGKVVAVTPFRVGGGGTPPCRLRVPSVRPVRRLCRTCGVRGLAGEDAGSGFEFGSRFDDMPGGARGLGVNG